MNKSRVRCSTEAGHQNLSAAAAFSLSLFLAVTTLSCSGLGRLTNKQSGRVSGYADAPVERPLPLASPRMTSYANLQISVTKGAIAATEVNGSDGSNSAVANMTLSITNTSNDSVRIKSGLWQLRLGDGAIYKEPFDDVFAARDTQERKLTFSVPTNAVWSGAQLIVDEQDKEPAVLAAGRRHTTNPGANQPCAQWGGESKRARAGELYAGGRNARPRRIRPARGNR